MGALGCTSAAAEGFAALERSASCRALCQPAAEAARSRYRRQLHYASSVPRSMLSAGIRGADAVTAAHVSCGGA